MHKLSRVLRGIQQIIAAPWLMFVSYFPGIGGNALRYCYYKRKLKYLGKKAVIEVGVHIQNPQYVSIGENSQIARNVIILAGPYAERGREIIERPNPNCTIPKGEVWIGKHCFIGPGCIVSGMAGMYMGDYAVIVAGGKLYSFSHHYRSRKSCSKRVTASSRAPGEMQVLIAGPIVLGNGVFLAANVFVLPGVTVGKDAFARIGTVIDKDVQENLIVAGNPMSVVTRRYG